MRHFIGIVIASLILVIAALAPSTYITAQDATQAVPAPTCAQLLTQVQEHLKSNCNDLDRDQMCYGNSKIAVDYQDPTTADQFPFANAGDIVPITAIKSITTGPLNLENGEWGVAVLKAQTVNLANTSAGQAVTFIMYGDTAISNLATAANNAPDAVSCNATVTRQTRLRGSPNTSGQVIRQIEEGTTLKVSERSTDNAWVYGDYEGKQGWLFASNLELACGIRDLPAFNPAIPLKIPAVRSFYFSTGINAQAACTDLPPSGLFIQAPTGHKVTFTANGADFTVGSSVLFSAQPDGQMHISVIEGEVLITVNGVKTKLVTGEETSFPLGGIEGLQVVGPAEPVKPIEDFQVIKDLYLPTICDVAAAAGLNVPCEVVQPTPTATIEVARGGGFGSFATNTPTAVPTSIPTTAPTTAPTNPPPPPPPTVTPSYLGFATTQIMSGNAADVSGGTFTVKECLTQAISGLSIVASVGALSNGIFSSTSTYNETLTTDSSGCVTTSTVSHGPQFGEFSIQFTSNAFSGSAGMLINNMSGIPASVTVYSGNNQLIPVDTDYAPFIVEVKDSANNLIWGAPLTTQVPTTGPSGVFDGEYTFKRITSANNGQGMFQPLTANSVAGTYSLPITYNGPGGPLTVNFTLTQQ